MNDISSRSHAIFILRMEKKVDKHHKIFAKLNLVDLAGSERIRVTGAKGQRLAECKKINQSLGELSNVISSLTRKKATHVPYRNSKLTRMLEDSLGGNSYTSFIATVSPAHESFSETLSTLKFASRAKNIKNVIRLNKKNTRVKPQNIFKKYDLKMRTLRELKGITSVEEEGQAEIGRGFMEDFQFEEEAYEDELEKYKELLLKQRDVLITVTNKLNTKDEIIKTLRREKESLKKENEKLKRDMNGVGADRGGTGSKTWQIGSNSRHGGHSKRVQRRGQGTEFGDQVGGGQHHRGFDPAERLARPPGHRLQHFEAAAARGSLS